MALFNPQTKSNLTASAAPSSTDDSSKGYSVGSVWFRSDVGVVYRCRDATASAAKWVPVSSAPALHPGYIAGNWYYPGGMTGIIAGGTAVAANTLYLIPIVIFERCTISDLAARVSTLGTSGNFQLGIYALDPSNLNRPGVLIDKTAATLSTNAAGNISGPLGGNQQIEPGIYFLGLNCDNSTAAFASFTSTTPWVSQMLGSSTLSNIMGNSTAGLVLKVSATFGGTTGFPSTLVGATFVEEAPGSAHSTLIAFKVASVP